MTQFPLVSLAGENALIIYFSDKPSAIVSAEIQQVEYLIRQSLPAVIIDLVPSYASLLVLFDLTLTDHHFVRQTLRQCLVKSQTQLNISRSDSGDNSDSKLNRLIELPAYYGKEVGIDLAVVAKHAQLSIEEVIALHQSTEYRVYAIGFAPGFAYLGDVDSRIATPRLATPRAKVPRGAIAIADQQTAVYPAQSPGGWNIIGLCPKKMFDANQEPTMPVQVGDRVKFIEINQQEFLALGGEIA
jgi:KipI family sensor histidine kinase inhibitor